MKRGVLVGSFLLGLLLGGGTVATYSQVHHPRTQMVAVCDQRGNTVYTTNTGNVFVLPGCR